MSIEQKVNLFVQASQRALSAVENVPRLDADRIPAVEALKANARAANELAKELGRAPRPARAQKAADKVDQLTARLHEDIETVDRALRDVAAQRPPGDLLYVGDVRAACRLSKSRFDAAALALQKQARASLHHHDHPFALADADRDALVWSPRGSSQEYEGTYYIGIVPRETAPAKREKRGDLEEHIRAAYFGATGGRLDYVRLAELRSRLPNLDRDTLDAALKSMQQQGKAVLYPIDNPRRLRPEDHAAHLMVSGERRDLFCLKPA